MNTSLHPSSRFALATLTLAWLLLGASGCVASARARALPHLIFTARYAWPQRHVVATAVASFPLRRVSVGTAALATPLLSDDLEHLSLHQDGGEEVDRAWRRCPRRDTCAWQRERVVSALGALGVAP